MPFPNQFPILLPGQDTAALIPEIDHAATAVARLAQYIRTKPNVIKLLNSFNAQSQALETTLQDLLNERALNTAYGDQLGVIGDLLKQPRGGLSDDDYRPYLQARVRLYLSSGTVEDVLGVFSLIKPAGTTLKLRDEFNAAFALEINGAAITASSAVILLAFLRLARAAGVRGILEWRESAPSVVFTLDGSGAQALDNGKFAGAAV